MGFSLYLSRIYLYGFYLFRFRFIKIYQDLKSIYLDVSKNAQ